MVQKRDNSGASENQPRSGGVSQESSSENRLKYPNKRESFSQRNNEYIDNRYRGVMSM
jgi:hypothetical protein